MQTFLVEFVFQQTLLNLKSGIDLMPELDQRTIRARAKAMKKKTIGCVFAVVTLMGCASKSSEIDATFVSPVGYQSYSCEQLQQEAQSVSRQAAIASGQQDKIRKNDTVKTTVGVILFWPVLLFNKGDGATAANLANLKGQMEAIQQASVQKNCGITFNKS